MQIKWEGIWQKQCIQPSTQQISKLPADLVVYQGHGASTIERELRENYALPEKEFVDFILENQPFIPDYFSYNVALNKAGAPPLKKSLAEIIELKSVEDTRFTELLIDIRAEKKFKEDHINGALNI